MSTDADTGTDTGTGTGTDTDAGSTTPTLAEAQAEAEKWKALARKHEAEQKRAQKELDTLRTANMTADEKAIADARNAGRSEAQTEFAQRLAAAEIRAALTGIVPKPDDVIGDLNLAKYVNDKGEPDADAIKELATKFAAMVGDQGKRKPPPDFGQGQRGGPGQATADDWIREGFRRKQAGDVL